MVVFISETHVSDAPINEPIVVSDHRHVEVVGMLKSRWTQLGPPTSPGVVFVRGIGDVRVTQEDIDTYSKLPGDPEVACEHTSDDPKAGFRISGLAPKAPTIVDPDEDQEGSSRPSSPRPARSRRGQRGGSRSWLDVLLRR